MNKNLPVIIAGAVFIAVGTASDPAIAITVFQDFSNEPNSSSSNSFVQFNNAASALGAVNLIDFENLPLGKFSTLEIAPDVTLTLSNVSEFNDGIAKDTTLKSLGFNTTPNGEKFVKFDTPFISLNTQITSNATFSFADPIQSFGTNITALDQAPGIQLSFLFNDGTSQSIPVVGASPDASSSSQFFGFTDPNKHISSVTVQQRYTNVELVGGLFGTSNYTVGIDDVYYVKSVSEPSSFLSLLALGVIGGCSVLKLKRQQNPDTVEQCTTKK